MSKDDDERLKNLLLFKMFATDKEMEEMAPGALIVLLLIGVIVGGYFLIKWL